MRIRVGKVVILVYANNTGLTFMYQKFKMIILEISGSREMFSETVNLHLLLLRIVNRPHKGYFVPSHDYFDTYNKSYIKNTIKLRTRRNYVGGKLYSIMSIQMVCRPPQ